MTEFECVVHNFIVDNLGTIPLRNGLPDFFVELDGKLLGVEAKQGHDKVQENQKLAHEVLKRAGIEVVVVRPETYQDVLSGRVAGSLAEEKFHKHKQSQLLTKLKQSHQKSRNKPCFCGISSKHRRLFFKQIRENNPTYRLEPQQPHLCQMRVMTGYRFCYSHVTTALKSGMPESFVKDCE